MIEIEMMKNYGVSPLRETPTIEWRFFSDYGFRGRSYFPEGRGVLDGLPIQYDAYVDGISTSQNMMLDSLKECVILTKEDWDYIIMETKDWWEQ